MTFSDFPLISILIFLPFAASVFLMTATKVAERALYWISVALAAVNFILAVVLLLNFTGGTSKGFHFGEQFTWVKELGLRYQVAADSISAWLIVLTAFLGLVAIFSAGGITTRPRLFWAAMLALEGGIIGVFSSTNLLLFYIFWEVMLIPAYFAIGSWGETNFRVRAAIRFVLFTLAGSLLMLVAILFLAFTTTTATGQFSLDYLDVQRAIGNLSPDTQRWLFLAFAAAFIVKVPLVPFHMWLPDAYAEAPAPALALIAGAMSKTGAYGFLRFCVFLFPAVANEFAPYFAALALAGIIYGALAALGERDIKRILAYSSLSHMGFIILGIFAINNQGVNGAVLQMVNHGIVTPALFLAAAALYTRTGTYNLEQLGGLQNRWPRMAALFLVLALASLGLPGLNQFAGEFLIIGGSFLASPIYSAIAVVGVVLAAWYMMRFFQTAWHGPEPQGLRLAGGDMLGSEYVLFVPLVLLIVLLGVAPSLVTGVLDSAVNDWLRPLVQVAQSR
ncbi:MAG TPA: NADH-quinone oxidoreductase subunit M [Chloroflexia bacterium]|nr:NADH-quinone oxidoreductase subunit M [Chloroflexia bacterium]